MHKLKFGDLIPLNVAKAKNQQQTLHNFQSKSKDSESLGATIVRLIAKDRISPHCIAKSLALKTLFRKAFITDLTEYFIWEEIKKTGNELIQNIKYKLKNQKIYVSVDDWTSKASISFCKLNVSATIDNKKENFCLGLIELESTDVKNLSFKNSRALVRVRTINENHNK